MNNERIKECTALSAEILKNFELDELPVRNIILKCLRLCRLLGDKDGILLFILNMLLIVVFSICMSSVPMSTYFTSEENFRYTHLTSDIFKGVFFRLSILCESATVALKHSANMNVYTLYIFYYFNELCVNGILPFMCKVIFFYISTINNIFFVDTQQMNFKKI